MNKIFKTIYRFYRVRIKHILYMDEKIELYRKHGVHIGNNCKIYSPIVLSKDCSLLSIGNNVTVSREVTFLMHDNAIIKPSKGRFTDVLGKIVIGDNCFIGWKSIILPGVKLANNTIVGAGSVVTKSVLRENCVIAGNPARFICTVNEYYSRNKYYSFNLDGMNEENVRDMISANDYELLSKKNMNLPK